MGRDREGAAEPTILRALQDRIAIVTLNRPQARNAVNPALAGELERCIAEIEADPGVDVAIVTGAGTHAFCAGADLREVAAGNLEGCFTPAGGFAGFVNARRTKPWIAAVNGPALAGGFEIVLACDLAVAATTARFGLPEVKRGLIASAGGLYRLPRTLPRAIALELILTGDSIPAGRACSIGLVNRVVEPADLMAEAFALAGSICANAPLAVRGSLAIANAAAQFEDALVRSLGDNVQARLAHSDDYREGSLAFLEKRQPVWKGR